MTKYQKQPGQSGRGLVFGMCIAQILNMAGIFAFPALLPDFMDLWNLTNAGAGWINGIYFAGYTLTVPVLAGLTDREDPRWIYLGSSLFGIAGSFGFAFFANGFWTALVFRLLAGIGLAGTYIPGLKGLVDRLEVKSQARGISFYTATFSLGTALSFFATGFISVHLDWRWAFGFAGIAGVLAMIVAAFMFYPLKPAGGQKEQKGHFLDFRPVLRNRQAMGYILAYAAHTWELFAARSWVVAFLTFALTLQAGGPDGFLRPSTVGALTALVAMWASVGGAELAIKFGRQRMLRLIMWGSALYACLLGFLSFLPYPALVILCMGYFFFVQGDSAILHAGTIQSADKDQRGLTMALQSLIGFGGAFFGPLVVGLVLDMTKGAGIAISWGVAFISMGFAVALGPVFIRFLCGKNTP